MLYNRTRPFRHGVHVGDGLHGLVGMRNRLRDFLFHNTYRQSSGEHGHTQDGLESLSAGSLMGCI